MERELVLVSLSLPSLFDIEFVLRPSMSEMVRKRKKKKKIGGMENEGPDEAFSVKGNQLPLNTYSHCMVSVGRDDVD